VGGVILSKSQSQLRPRHQNFITSGFFTFQTRSLDDEVKMIWRTGEKCVYLTWIDDNYIILFQNHGLPINAYFDRATGYEIDFRHLSMYVRFVYSLIRKANGNIEV